MKDDLCKQSTHFCQYLAIHVVNYCNNPSFFFFLLIILPHCQISCNFVSKYLHWDDSVGWDGERGGRGVRIGNTCTPMADS